MVQFEKMTSSDDSSLDSLLDLYEKSFPIEERRDLSQLKRMIDSNSEMSVNSALVDGVVSGIVICWDFDEFRYLEHFAVFPSMRNKNLGQQILNYWASLSEKPRILEVEPADDPLSLRRVNFYKRNGYQVIYTDYIQPSYYTDADACRLWIMASKSDIDISNVLNVIKYNVYDKPRMLLQ